MKLNEINLFSPNVPLFFDDFVTRDSFQLGIRKTTPQHNAIPFVNIENGYILEMAIPGAIKEDFNIFIENELLLISFLPKRSHQSPNGLDYSKQAFSYQPFVWAFYLPQIVDDVSRIIVNYSHGILQLVVPRRKNFLGLPPTS